MCRNRSGTLSNGIHYGFSVSAHSEHACTCCAEGTDAPLSDPSPPLRAPRVLLSSCLYRAPQQSSAGQILGHPGEEDLGHSGHTGNGLLVERMGRVQMGWNRSWCRNDVFYEVLRVLTGLPQVGEAPRLQENNRKLKRSD